MMLKKNKKLLIHAWIVYKINDAYFLPYTHWVYLKEIKNMYEHIGLISPILNLNPEQINTLCPIKEIGKINIHSLPGANTYLSSIKNFNYYRLTYKAIAKDYDEIYVRYPSPFGWLSKFYFKPKHRIIHFVGSPFNVTWLNPNFSFLKKLTFNTLFVPEHFLFTLACKNARVFCNGFHLKKSLNTWGVKAKAIISSTLNEDDFFYDEQKITDIKNPKLLYIGYLRKAKGIETLIKAFSLVKNSFDKATFTIIGEGDFRTELEQLAKQLNLTDSIKFVGHVDNRITLNEYIRKHDIFCFASVSEGSPRVILEAMANYIHVVSTPVGALPQIFKNGVDINFSNFNDHLDFANNILSIIVNSTKYLTIKNNAFNKVKEFTLKKFIYTLFTDET